MGGIFIVSRAEMDRILDNCAKYPVKRGVFAAARDLSADWRMGVRFVIIATFLFLAFAAMTVNFPASNAAMSNAAEVAAAIDGGERAEVGERGSRGAVGVRGAVGERGAVVSGATFALAGNGMRNICGYEGVFGGVLFDNTLIFSNNAGILRNSIIYGNILEPQPNPPPDDN